MSDALFRDGSGPPLVLLHGLTASWRIWRPVLPHLLDHHEVIAPTLAGHRGALPLPDGCPVTVPELANALERHLDELGIGSAHIAGNSLGGWLALELGRRGRALSVTAFSPAGAWRTQLHARRLIVIFGVGERLLRHAGPGTARFLSRPRARALMLRDTCEHPERIPASELAGLVDDAAGCTIISDLVGSVLTVGQIEPWPSASIPVRVVWAARDRNLPFAGYGRPLLARVPHAESTFIAGRGACGDDRRAAGGRARDPRGDVAGGWRGAGFLARGLALERQRRAKMGGRVLTFAFSRDWRRSSFVPRSEIDTSRVAPSNSGSGRVR